MLTSNIKLYKIKNFTDAELNDIAVRINSEKRINKRLRHRIYKYVFNRVHGRFSFMCLDIKKSFGEDNYNNRYRVKPFIALDKSLPEFNRDIFIDFCKQNDYPHYAEKEYEVWYPSNENVRREFFKHIINLTKR
jgi:hypothetical protein